MQLENFPATKLDFVVKLRMIFFWIFRDLWYKTTLYEATLKIMDKIEHVLEVPDILDGYIERKQYLHAVHLLQV